MPTVESHAEPPMPSSGAPKINRATPRLAPELTPSTYGPASGLRNRVCICSPLTASAAPARIATMAFIRRMSMTILRVTGSPPPIRAANTSFAEMPTDPTIMSAAKSTTTRAVSRIKSMWLRLLISIVCVYPDVWFVRWLCPSAHRQVHLPRSGLSSLP